MLPSSLFASRWPLAASDSPMSSETPRPAPRRRRGSIGLENVCEGVAVANRHQRYSVEAAAIDSVTAASVHTCTAHTHAHTQAATEALRLNDTALFAGVKRALTSTVHAEHTAPAGPRGGLCGNPLIAQAACLPWTGMCSLSSPGPKKEIKE